MMNFISLPLLIAEPKQCLGPHFYLLRPDVRWEGFGRGLTGGIITRGGRSNIGIPLEKSIPISLRSDLLSHLQDLEKEKVS